MRLNRSIHEKWPGPLCWVCTWLWSGARYWREVMEINTERAFFFFLAPQWNLCSELRYWIRGSRVLCTICIHWHFRGSQVARCAPVDKAINGLILPLLPLFLQYRQALNAPAGETFRRLAEDSQQGENVFRMHLAHIFCSHLNGEIRWAGREGGCGTLCTADL